MSAPLGADEAVNYTRDVKPIFVKNCVAMPPKEKPRLSSKEIELLRAWIDQGAKPPANEVAETAKKSSHWAFQPIVRPALPKVKNTAWARNPIDHFVLARLEKERIAPAPEADRTTLIRRLSLDLLGLPPTIAQIEEFLADSRPDAYERLVEGLLASPHYGERWGRHWLDVARYADSDGYSIDAPRTIWPYRDWVIEALNKDLPFDQFIIQQIAGDLLPNATKEMRVATGFHRNTLRNGEGGIDREQFRVEAIVDRLNTTAAAFLGLTIGCAQCHDHKFDPLAQREFYQLFAFFNNCDESDLSLATPEQAAAFAQVRQEQEPWRATLRTLDRNSPARQLAWEKNLTEADKARLPAAINKFLTRPEVQRSPEEKQQIAKFLSALDQVPEAVAGLGDPVAGGLVSAALVSSHLYFGHLRGQAEKRLADLRKQEPNITYAMTLVELAKPRETRIHIRGDFMRQGKPVYPATPAVLNPLKAGLNPNRLDLAHWMVDPANPLTGRVIVNRVWQHYFGLGIVETENDFGAQGIPPTHPELLDWLAWEFRAGPGTRDERQGTADPSTSSSPLGWSLKGLHRLIVTSATYRQSSRSRPELATIDPRNRLLARQNRLRLEAEIVRDSALAASGLLNPKIGGPSVFPPQPDGVFAFTQVRREWKADDGLERFRRGMYTHFWRSAPHPALMAFDAPDATSTCTRRHRSNTALQALTLLNDRAFFEFAQGLASRILRDGSGTEAERVRHAFRLSLARVPTAGEEERLVRLLVDLQRELRNNPKEAERLAPADLPVGTDRAEAAAWTLVGRVLLNLDEFVNRE